VVVLDVDYHHGNGTQSIFYSRDDVLFGSLHADPTVEYPSFLGHADERGAGAGPRDNHNNPLPVGTAWDAGGAARDDACTHISAHGPDAVVVSLGVDTSAGDPISKFELVADDFSRMGRRIAALGRPTLFVLEGGYAVDDIGANTVNVLTGFEEER
jgi:acetoin utilization deacetylase AcuC-like enzyme